MITIKLDAGAHSPGMGRACLMEAVSWMAGEPWSDAPMCADPALAAYGRTLNDRLSTTDRQRLLPFIPRLIGTRGDEDLSHRRAFLAADYAVRVFAPIALRAAGLEAEAVKLERLPAVVDAPASDASYAASSAASYASSYAAYSAASYAASHAAAYASYAASHAASYAASHAASHDAADAASHAASHAASAASYAASYASDASANAAAVDRAIECFEAMIALGPEQAIPDDWFTALEAAPFALVG